MAIEDITKRFVDEIKLRAYDDKYVDKNEEREILQIAIQQGISSELAHSALAQACEQNGYMLESAVLKDLQEQVETVFGNNGMIDQKGFDLIFQNAKRKIAGKKSDLQVKRLIVEIMEDGGMTKVKKGWFSNWYATLKKDIGMA